MIAKEGFRVYGIDLSSKAIELGKLMLKKWNVKAELKIGNMCEIQYNDNFFDVNVDIFSSYCLIEKNFKICISEVARTLKSGGKFFSYTPSTNSDAFKNYLPAKKLDDYTLDGIKRKTSPYYKNYYPFRFISPSKYREILEDQGFKVTYIEVVSRTYRNMKEKFEFVIIEAEK